MSTMFSCPSCGTGLRVDAIGNSPSLGRNWQRSQEFALGAAPAGAEYSREAPTASMNTIEAGARLPLIQAAITGGAGFLLTSVATWYWYWPWSTPFVVGAAVGAMSWLYLLQDSRRLLRTSETVTADPGKDDPAFTVEITESLSDGRKRMAFAHFPRNCKPAHVVKFAEAARDDRLTPEGAALSRRKFNAVRDIFIARGWADWRNREHHSQGVEPTLPGKRVFPKLIEELA